MAATGDLDAFAAALAGAAGVVGVDRRDGARGGRVDDGPRRAAPGGAPPSDAGVAVSGIEVVEPDLEDVFLHLTGKALRD